MHTISIMAARRSGNLTYTKSSCTVTRFGNVLELTEERYSLWRQSRQKARACDLVQSFALVGATTTHGRQRFHVKQRCVRPDTRCKYVSIPRLPATIPARNINQRGKNTCEQQTYFGTTHCAARTSFTTTLKCVNCLNGLNVSAPARPLV